MQLLCGAVMTANAQVSKASMLRTGPGVSFFTGHNGSKSIPSFGFSIGLAHTFPLSKKIYLKPEIAVSKKGGKIDYDMSGVFTGHVKYRIYYLNAPVMCGVTLTDWLLLEAGIYGAIKLGGSFDFQGNFATGYETFTQKNLKSLDYGTVVALVFQTGWAQLGLRYSHGLCPVLGSDNTNATALLGNAGNNSLQITIQKTRLRKKGKTAN